MERVEREREREREKEKESKWQVAEGKRVKTGKTRLEKGEKGRKEK